MSTIEQSIDVNSPVSIVSRRWQQFESFPDDAEARFLVLDDEQTRVIVQMTFEPRTLGEPEGSVVGIGDGHLTDDLESFKEFIERRAA